VLKVARENWQVVIQNAHPETTTAIDVPALNVSSTICRFNPSNRNCACPIAGHALRSHCSADCLYPLALHVDTSRVHEYQRGHIIRCHFA
jgi:hypothetical protein